MKYVAGINFAEREALYFKINVLQMIQNAHSNPSRIEPLLNKFLDINYNLLLIELESEENIANLNLSQDVPVNVNNTSINSC